MGIRARGPSRARRRQRPVEGAPTSRPEALRPLATRAPEPVVTACSDVLTALWHRCAAASATARAEACNTNSLRDWLPSVRAPARLQRSRRLVRGARLPCRTPSHRACRLFGTQLWGVGMSGERVDSAVPAASVTAAQLSREGRSRWPRLLGPEPRATSTPCPAPTSPGSATARRSWSVLRPGSPTRARARRSTSCSPTRRSTRSRWPPVPTHAAIAKRVLEAGKHCFVEKPLAQSVADAEAVVAAAGAAGRTLMVGHLLEYHPGLERLKALVDEGDLGEVHYIYGNRLNLGKLRADERAWSLGAHDVSVVLLAGEVPLECHAHGESCICARRRRRGVLLPALPLRSRRPPAPVLARPAQGAALHGRWLEAHGHLRRHGARAEADRLRQGLRSGVRGLRRVHRALGDVWSPQIPNDEPLRIECRHFVERVRDGARRRAPTARQESACYECSGSSARSRRRGSRAARSQPTRAQAGRSRSSRGRAARRARAPAPAGRGTTPVSPRFVGRSWVPRCPHRRCPARGCRRRG